MEFNAFLFIAILAFGVATARIVNDNGILKGRSEMVRPTMAPNSKFLNPHLDDATNLQLAISAFADALNDVDHGDESDALYNSPEDESNDFVDIDDTNKERKAKSLKHWNALSHLSATLGKKTKSF